MLSIIHEGFDAIPLSKNYILQLHKIMYSHMNNPLAGQTKNVQNYISVTYPDGHTEIFFTPPLLRSRHRRPWRGSAKSTIGLSEILICSLLGRQ